MHHRVPVLVRLCVRQQKTEAPPHINDTQPQQWLRRILGPLVALWQLNLTPGGGTQHILPTIFCYNTTCTSRSRSKIMWKIELWNYLWLQKVWIVLHRSPTGISVWDSSPSLPLPRRPPSVVTVCSVKAGQLSNPHAPISSLWTSWHSALWCLRPFLVSTRRE